jgi:hypothetical protein
MVGIGLFIRKNRARDKARLGILLSFLTRQAKKQLRGGF